MPNRSKEFSIAHPSGLHIQKDLREEEARVVDGVTTRDHRNGYAWYYLPRAQIAGQEISMGLCFFHQQLDFISLAVVMESDNSTFADWSPEKERARVDATSRWFA